ncbi:MAG TPA: SAVED domain-containing protein [Myxococcota bacterium]|nr:SAVED domain-containing protein [Myxococcota bacterium]
MSTICKPVSEARNVPHQTRLFLYVHAGGRCGFDGCNRYLLEHDPTGAPGNFAEMAHIYAFAGAGPRGGQLGRPTEVHALSNLILLCPICHKLVDDQPYRYTVEVLKRFKQAHEERVFLLTEMGPNRRTVALVLKARVAGQRVDLTLDEMQRAVAPRYLSKHEVVEIDLNAIPDSPREHYWRLGQQVIDKQVAKALEQSFEAAPTKHLSVFALGPIPLLVYLDTRLSNKIPTALFQRHRDTEDWTWKGGGNPIAYETGRFGMARAVRQSLSSFR